MYDTITEVTRLVDEWDAIEEKIDAAKWELELRAKKWADDHHTRWGCCTASGLDFRMLKNDKVIFGTDCSYDGKDAGLGLVIPADELEGYFD